MEVFSSLGPVLKLSNEKTKEKVYQEGRKKKKALLARKHPERIKLRAWSEFSREPRKEEEKNHGETSPHSKLPRHVKKKRGKKGLRRENLCPGEY